MEKLQFKEFKPTSWAIDNKTSIYVLTIIIAVFGIMSYNSLPKEQFPEIVIPTVIVNTIYPGTSPSDMENLVTRPLEKNIKSINGVKRITSNSVQDFSSIVVEFVTGIDVTDAKQKVKDAVDKTKRDLPNDLLEDPSVMEIDFSEFPIMNINLSGEIELEQLKKHAELAQDRIESLPGITRVDIVGALDREIQIDVDMYRMQAASVTFTDIERAIAAENMTVSGGNISMQGMDRSVRVVGEFSTIDQLANVVINSSSGAIVYLKDIATITDGNKKQENFARLDDANVVTLNVIKKSGENLLEASDNIKHILDELAITKFPSALSVTIAGDQSKYTRSTLTELNNTIIIGFILVTIVLMFFMGLTNAMFVAASVPLSMALAYIVMPWIGFTMNMLVMFAFIFALGIVVDDAIVVIENTHRIFNKTKLSIANSAKAAAGEVFIPILSGTLTTLAPFFPLAFWPGVTGQFMYFIPVTLIITLFASLIVAYIINPVFAVSFMKKEHEIAGSTTRRNIFTTGGIIAGLGIVFHMFGWPAIANLTLFVALSFILHKFYGYKLLFRFQERVIPKIMQKYEKLLEFALYRKRPYYFLWSLVGLFFFTLFITAVAKPKVVFFPDNEPNTAIVYIKMPVGTSVEVTDSVTRLVEQRVRRVLGENNPNVESVQANVALGASESVFDAGTNTSHRGKVTANFVEFRDREKGASTQAYLDRMREAVRDIPGAEITVDKNSMGPPTGKPLNIEISGDDLMELSNTATAFIRHIDSMGIPGIEELKTDFELSKPELLVEVDRVRANHEGITTGQVGMELRTAIQGKEITKFRDGEDQYPVQLRYSLDQREDINKLLNLKITYRDMNSGLLRQIPLSSVATVKYQNSTGGINRKDVKRVITVSSNVLSGYTANEIVASIREALPGFQRPEAIDIKITGEQEDQAESSSFLGRAMFLALCIIMFVLITQFNSLSKPVIIVSEVVFSIIGVLLGYVIFDMTISIIMTGMGIVALAGIVVRNGILLVEFTDVLKAQGMSTRKAIIQAGSVRITPVLLTALSTILGMIPLAIGLNIDFVSLLTSLQPNIHFGGDNVMFFGPLAWTIVFGLAFATFLTLVIIPVMYFIMYAGKVKVQRAMNRMKYK